MVLALILLLPACSADASSTEPSMQGPTSVAVPKKTAAPNQLSGETAPASGDSNPVLVGEVAPDFPLELFALDETDEVLLSSVTEAGPQGRALSLNVRTQKNTQEILKAYEKSLGTADFTLTSTSEVEGMAAQATFTKGVHVLTIGVLDEESARIVSVGGTVPLP